MFWYMFVFAFFFFKQKTAYEMRISDWSSDVCSSDLARRSTKRNSRPPRRPPPTRTKARPTKMSSTPNSRKSKTTRNKALVPMPLALSLSKHRPSFVGKARPLHRLGANGWGQRGSGHHVARNRLLRITQMPTHPQQYRP